MNEGIHWEETHGYNLGERGLVGGCAAYRGVDAFGDVVMAFGYHGNGGMVSVSHDGGQTFEDVAFDPHLIFDVVSLHIVDSTTAFISGVSPDRPCSLFRTRDGGATWEDISRTLGAHCFSEMLFLSSTDGYGVATLAGDNTGGWGNEAIGIAHTKDGGETWEFERLQPQPNGGSLRLLADAVSLYAVNESGLWTARR
jgi:photosystem II stability/assembly factor-like uncharacterized protein